MCQNTYGLPVNAEQMELTQHGSSLFPLGVYQDEFSLYAMHTVPWHWHPEVEFAVVVRGKVECEGNERMTLEEGEGVYFAPNLLHMYQAAPGYPDAGMISMVFQPQMLQPEKSLIWSRYMQPMLHDSNFFSCKLPKESTEVKLLQEIYRLNGGASLCGQPLPELPYAPNRELEQYALLVQLMMHMVRDRYSRIQTEKTVSVPSAGRMLRQMIAWISVHYMEPVQIKQIAAAAGISDSSCYRIFHQYLNQTPLAFLNQYRLEKAMGLLMQTDQSIATIADCCGFSQQSYFGKLFKETTGMSPGEYRKQMEAKRIDITPYVR